MLGEDDGARRSASSLLINLEAVFAFDALDRGHRVIMLGFVERGSIGAKLYVWTV